MDLLSEVNKTEEKLFKLEIEKNHSIKVESNT